MSLSFFYGDEDYLMEQEIKKQKEKLLDKNFSAMNFKSLSNLSYLDFISVLQTQPMMFGAQMIVIDVENFFSSYSFEDNQIEELKKTLENIPETLHIIFTLKFERNSNSKPDSRKKIYKVLSKYTNMTEFVSIPAYKTDELLNFINKEAKKNNVIIEKQAAIKLLEQVRNNLRELAKEIEKLVLIAYPKNKITEGMVKENCITNEFIFDMADKLFVGKKVTALKEFKKLCEKQHPLEILSALQTTLQQSIIIKLNEKKMSPMEIAKLAGIKSDYIVKLKMQTLKSSNLKSLVNLKCNLTNAEYKIKSGEALDVQSEIENALLNW